MDVRAFRATLASGENIVGGSSLHGMFRHFSEEAQDLGRTQRQGVRGEEEGKRNPDRSE